MGNEVNVVFSSRFEEIEALGTVVLSKTPDAHDVGEKMKRLDDDRKSINDMFGKRSKDLEDAYNLSVSPCW